MLMQFLQYSRTTLFEEIYQQIPGAFSPTYYKEKQHNLFDKYRVGEGYLENLERLDSDIEFINHCFGTCRGKSMRGTVTVDAVSVDPIVKFDIA